MLDTVIHADTIQALTFKDLVSALDRISRPMVIESVPLTCDPDDYPLQQLQQRIDELEDAEVLDTVIHNDCLTVLRGMADNSVDACVTPPGLGAIDQFV